MDRSYRNRLLREAVEDPSRLLRREKFWKLELWPHYLRRCDDIVFADPAAGLELSKPAPQFAARIAENSPDASGPDLMLLGYSYRASAYRRVDDYGRAEEAMEEASRFRDSASPKALAEHLRRLAYLRLFQRDPECFPIVEEAINIHRRGNLVNRHTLGECLICRGRAYVEFNQHGKSFADYTAALNHVSIKIDGKPYYCALHNLTNWFVIYGTDAELKIAYENLKPALVLLNTVWGRPYPKLKLRWLIAVVEARLGHYGRAELVFMEVRKGLVKMGLFYEVGMVSIDLAFLYLAQGRHAELEALVRSTVNIFRRLCVEAKALDALDVWRQAEVVTEDLLKRVRGMFAEHVDPIPKIAA